MERKHKQDQDKGQQIWKLFKLDSQPHDSCNARTRSARVEGHHLGHVFVLLSTQWVAVRPASQYPSRMDRLGQMLSAITDTTDQARTRLALNSSEQEKEVAVGTYLMLNW